MEKQNKSIIQESTTVQEEWKKILPKDYKTAKDTVNIYLSSKDGSNPTRLEQDILNHMLDYNYRDAMIEGLYKMYLIDSNLLPLDIAKRLLLIGLANQSIPPNKKEVHSIVAIFNLWQNRHSSSAPMWFDSTYHDMDELCKIIASCKLQECKSEILEIWFTAKRWWPKLCFNELPLIVKSGSDIKKEGEIKSGIMPSYMQDNINQSNLASDMAKFREKKQKEIIDIHDVMEKQIELEQRINKIKEEYETDLRRNTVCYTLTTPGGEEKQTNNGISYTESQINNTKLRIYKGNTVDSSGQVVLPGTIAINVKQSEGEKSKDPFTSLPNQCPISKSWESNHSYNIANWYDILKSHPFGNNISQWDLKNPIMFRRKDNKNNVIMTNVSGFMSGNSRANQGTKQFNNVTDFDAWFLSLISLSEQIQNKPKDDGKKSQTEKELKQKLQKAQEEYEIALAYSAILDTINSLPGEEEERKGQE